VSHSPTPNRGRRPPCSFATRIYIEAGPYLPTRQGH